MPFGHHNYENQAWAKEMRPDMEGLDVKFTREELELLREKLPGWINEAKKKASGDMQGANEAQTPKMFDAARKEAGQLEHELGLLKSITDKLRANPGASDATVH